MRKRAALVGFLVAFGLVLVAPVAAHAQEGEGDTEFTPEQIEEVTHEAEEIAEQNGATHADVECIPELIDGGRVDDCQEAPSPILPPVNELVWGTLSFLIVLGLIWKFGWPGIKKGMEARTDRIRTDLEAADSAKAEAEGVLAGYQAQVADAKSEGSRIIEEARQTADSMKRDLQAQAEADIAAMRQKAAADIESAKAQAMADLRGEVANIAIGAAERVVEHNLDPETNKALVESFIDQVGIRAELMAEPVGRTDRVQAYAEAIFNIAQAEGDSAELEDELFRFARILEGSDELREKLSDPHIPVALRQQVVEDLLGGKARPATTNIVSMLVGNGRVRELPGIVTAMTELSASRADKEVAEVHSAIPLSDDQVARLAEALRKSTGKSVDVRVVIDQSVKGGLVARVGDTVIDGSVRRRLEQLRNAL